MARQFRALVGLVIVTVALAAAACTESNATGPRTTNCDINNSNVCAPH